MSNRQIIDLEINKKLKRPISMLMHFNFEALKPIQKAIVELVYSRPGELSGDQIFLMLNQEQKNYSYATVYNNIRSLIKQELLIVIAAHNKKNPNRYLLSSILGHELANKPMHSKK